MAASWQGKLGPGRETLDDASGLTRSDVDSIHRHQVSSGAPPHVQLQVCGL